MMHDISETGLYTHIHRNSGNRREGTHVSMMNAKFKSYVKAFGKTQLH